MGNPDPGPWRELPLAPRAWGPGLLAGLVGAGMLGLAWTLGSLALEADGAPSAFLLPFTLFVLLIAAAGAFALLVAAAALAGGARVRSRRAPGGGERQLEIEESAAILRRRRRVPLAGSWVALTEEGLVVHGPGGRRWEAPSLDPGFGAEEAARWAASLDLALGPGRRPRSALGFCWESRPEAWQLRAMGWTAGPWVLALLGASFLVFVGGVSAAVLMDALPVTGGAAPILGLFALAGLGLLLAARGRARLRRTLTLEGGTLRLVRPPWSPREVSLAEGEVRCVSPRRPGSTGRGPLWALELPTLEGPILWSLPCGAEGHRSAARWIERARRDGRTRGLPE